MKKMRVFVWLMLFAVVHVHAQEAIWGKGPLVSPEVGMDKRVTFRFHAPRASSVQVTGDFLPTETITTPNGSYQAPGKAEMIRNEVGVWEYTSDVLSPELYGYSFIVDGLRTTDPSSVYLIRDVATLTNVFLIHGEQANLYAVNNVPHGAVTRCWYHSPTLGMDRRITIYTPPFYESNKKSYPVLYLLHGMGGDEEAWIELGRTAQILDNLIAQGRAKPMIVVMPNGNASQEAAPGESSLGFVSPNMQQPKTMEGSYEAAFPDIIQFVEKNYRTIKKKSGRAIAGLSMGGFHSLHISKQYPDKFDYIGLFSAAIFPRKNSTSPIYENMDNKLEVQFSKKPQLYWIAIGETDFLYKENVDFRKKLDEKGFTYIYFENEGGHIWRNWRIYLSKFAPMLF